MSPSATANGPTSSLRTIPLTYDISNSEDSARCLVVALNPEWKDSPGPIEFVKFKDGITNTLFKAIKKRPGASEHQVDKEAVLLRAYGNGTAVLIDRNREAQSHALLAENGLAPALLARFDNGLLYKFIEGTPCTPDDLQRPDVWPSIASLLGRWHGSLPTTETTSQSEDNKDSQYELIKKLIPGKPLPHLWSVMQKWINALPSKTDEQRARNEELKIAMIESAELMAHTPGLSSGSYILAHCDLLSGNVIVGPKTARDSRGVEVSEVSFIDYEYTTPAPAAFDLANHFAEYIGFDCDMSKIPSRSRRRAFLREYAAEYRKFSEPHPMPYTNGHGAHAANGDKSSSNDTHCTAPSLDEAVDQLMREVDEFRGLPGLYWGIWALIQATISSIDFDYTTYAETRLGEYWAWKGEHDGTRKRDGKELPLRERRWAQAED